MNETGKNDVKNDVCMWAKLNMLREGTGKPKGNGQDRRDE